MARILPREEADRKKAVLLTARAMDRLEADPRGARDDALEALRLAPDLVPASVTAAKALFREDNLRKGARVLEKIWKSNPHPEVAETYVRARIGDSVLDRLKRAEKLEALKPNHTESLLAVARAALDAGQYERARAKAEAAARQQSREGTYLLLADIEEAETGDQGRVRHWLAQAVRAGRDPTWTADGYVADKWAPVSPVTGKLDAFVWRVPVEQIAGPIEEGRSSGIEAEQAIRSLPPVRHTAPVAEEPVDVAVEEKPAPAPATEPVTIDAGASAATTSTVEERAARADGGADDLPATEHQSSGQAPDEPHEAAASEAAVKAAKDEPERAAKPVRLNGQTTTPPEVPNEARARPRNGEDSERSKQPFVRPPDDPGVDEDAEEQPKPRFRLF
jgi:HemY protein